MSDDWGDDLNDGVEADPFDVHETDDHEVREPGRLFGIDVTHLAEELAGPAIAASLQKAVRDAVKDVVTSEVTAQLDPTVIEELQQQAATAARRSVAAALDRLARNAQEKDEPQLYFGSVDEFVRGFLRPNYRRRVDGSKTLWAAEWWRYPEAILRLDALWRSWEHLRQDAQTGMSVWLRDHAEHHMSILLSPTGPFNGIGTGPNRVNTNEAGEMLPYTAPPEGLFPDVREAR